jgi:20S proteasome alpha/beta subunit
VTLALAVWNDAGVVLAADGLVSYGQSAGAQQLPMQKLTPLGDRSACAQVGNPIIAAGLATELAASPLGTDPTASRTAAEWLQEARAAAKQWTADYLSDAVFLEKVPLSEQFEAGALLVAGVASDQSFGYVITWLGDHYNPDAPNYTASGSGATAARIYLDAYSYFAIDDQPVLSLEALAARAMQGVARNNMEVGGQISLISIRRETSIEHPLPLTERSADAETVRVALNHWELLEREVAETLARYTAPSPPGEAADAPE